MDFSVEDITFGLLEIYPHLFQPLEDGLNVFEMLLLILPENNDVVKVCNHKIATVLQNHIH